MKKLSTEEFVSRISKSHNEIYDYLKTVYVNKRTKIIVTCNTHGDFEVLPNNHWSGQGCKECGYLNRNNRRTESDKFIQKAKEVHNNKYDYSNTNYETARHKIKIVCPIHGEFEQQAKNHLNGQGCKECSFMYSSFKKNDWITKAKNRQGVFYIIKCFNEYETFYKMGITSNTTKRRYAQKQSMPYNYEIIKEVVSSDLSYIWDLEKRFKLFKYKHRYIPQICFNGSSTECFK